MKISRFVGVLGLLTLVLTGCGGGLESTQNTSAGLPKSETSSASSASTAHENPAASSQATVSVPSGAFAGAGGSAPADALNLSSGSGSQGSLIQTPTQNIFCQLPSSGADLSEVTATDMYGCGVKSYMEDAKYPHTKGEGLPYEYNGWWFSFKDFDAVPALRATPGGVAYQDQRSNAGSVKTLNYGQTVVSGKFACGSAENGLTCWNAETGHGVFMHRDGYETF